MIQYLVGSFEGTGLFAILALLFFFLVFTLVLIRVFTMRRQEVDTLSKLPFEADELSDGRKLEND